MTGLARHPTSQPGLAPLAADLQDVASLDALAAVKPTHVFIATWSRQANEKENIRVNAAMVRNLLDAALPANSVRHVALVTGLKITSGRSKRTAPGRCHKRPSAKSKAGSMWNNFYYAQEDEVFAAAAHDGFHWSVHRPHTIIGLAVGNAMNMGTTLAVYASICRATGRPFRFPGSAVQWNSLTDMTDARQLARHLLWASTTPTVANEAFNVVDGDIFRWQWLWQRLAEWLGPEGSPFDGTVQPLKSQIRDDASIWTAMAAKYNLAEARLDRLISPWHTDADLGRPIEVVTDMSKSRRLGFLDYQSGDDAFFDLFGRLRELRLIP